MSASTRLAPAAILLALGLAEALGARLAAQGSLDREIDRAERITLENADAVARRARPDSQHPEDDAFIRGRVRAEIQRLLLQPGGIPELKSILLQRIAAADLPSPQAALLDSLRHRVDAAAQKGRTDVPLFDGAARADALARLLDARFAVRSADDFSESFDRALLAWLLAVAIAGAFVIGSIDPKSRSPKSATIAMAAFGALTLIGMTVLAVSAGPLSGALIAERVSLHVLVGAAASTLLLAALPWLLRAAARLDLDEPLADGRVALAAAIALLVLLALFGTGPAGSSARINLTTRFGAFQPLEPAKLLLVVALAQHLGRHRASFSLLRRPTDRTLGWWCPALLGPFLLVVLAILGSAFVLGDFGAGLVLAPTLALMIVAASGSVATAAVIAGAGLLALPLLVLLPWPVDSKVFIRIATWLVPYANGLPGGDQLALAEKAVASAGWLGSAWPSNPDSVPAGTHDLPVALLVERFGIAGLLLFAIAHLLLVHAGFAIGARLRGRREEIRYLPMALAALLAAQTAVALAGLAGLLPLSGIITPFLSEGGTGMLTCSIAAIGIARSGAARGGFAPSVPSEGDPFSRGLLVGFFATEAILVAAFVALASRAIGDPRRLTDPIPTHAADGHILPRPGPLLRKATSEIEPPPIIDARGNVIAHGRRRYPYADALAPVLGIARHGIAPFPGTLESELFLHHARFPRQRTEADLVESCAAHCESGEGAWTTAGLIPRTSPFKDLLVSRIETKHPGEELRFRPFFASDFAPLAESMRRGPDALARALERIRAEAPFVRTTLDAEVQKEIYALLVEAIHASKATLGAIVVRDAASGEVLVHASGEATDPERVGASIYGRPEVTGAFGSLRDHAALYAVPPGSTFKPITAVALLEHERAHPEFSPEPCVHHLRRGRKGWQGNLRIGRGPGSGWVADFGVDRPHGKLDLESAIEQSCNVYFAQAGLEVGEEALTSVVSRVEVTSFSATPGSIDLATAAIGQGKTLLTADQLSLAYAAIANGGTTLRCPLLFERDGSLPCKPLRLASAEDAQRIEAALRRVVSSKKATGTRAKEPKDAGFIVFGKTGTAEQARVRGEDRRRSAQAAAGFTPPITDDDPPRDHAWFAGFFDGASSGRRWAFAILLARGGTGGRAAAPLAPKIGAVLERHGYL